MATEPPATVPPGGPCLPSPRHARLLKDMSPPFEYRRVATEDLQQLEELVKVMDLGSPPEYDLLSQVGSTAVETNALGRLFHKVGAIWAGVGSCQGFPDPLSLHAISVAWMA